MLRKFSSNPSLAFVSCLAVFVVLGSLIWMLGPDPARIALVDKSKGQIITFGSIYTLLAVLAATAMYLLGVWCFYGWRRIFEIELAEATSNTAHATALARYLTITGYCLVILLGCYFLFIRLNATLNSSMEHDTFVYYDGAHRLLSGKQQHVDFHTPMGMLVNLIPCLGYQITGTYAGAVEWGSLLAGAFLLAVGSYALATRFTIAAAIPLATFFCLMTAVPLAIEAMPDEITTAMWLDRTDVYISVWPRAQETHEQELVVGRRAVAGKSVAFRFLPKDFLRACRYRLCWSTVF
jgi:hypothetical protein